MDSGNGVPGGVYLCQVDEQISCAACCGLYNVAHPSREALVQILAYRTDTFACVPRGIDDILGFKEEVEARESRKRPLPEFHHCPFIGLAGKNRSRVGCLLHPSADGNEAIDYRGLSYYGGMACRDYFCPTHHRLPRVYKEIVLTAVSDWYLYGLVITETNMLTTFFREVERCLNRPIRYEDIFETEESRESVKSFLALKLDWPFRPDPFSGLCNYFFKDQLYPKPPINYEAIGETSSRYDTILRGLESCFNSVNELRRAENLLDGLIDKTTGQLT